MTQVNIHLYITQVWNNRFDHAKKITEIVCIAFL